MGNFPYSLWKRSFHRRFLMDERTVFIVACFVLISILSACGTSAGAQPYGLQPNNAPAGETGPDSNAPDAGNTQADAQTSETDTNAPGSIEVEPASTDSIPQDTYAATLESGTTMRVLWTVSSYVIGKNATWGEAEAIAMLFKPLDITETEIVFDGQACQHVTFQREAVSPEYLSNAWNITSQELGIDFQEIQVIKSNCSLPGFQEYMRLPDRRLIVPIHGVFFFFKPAVSY
jgi:hypothetical protein